MRHRYPGHCNDVDDDPAPTIPGAPAFRHRRPRRTERFAISGPFPPAWRIDYVVMDRFGPQYEGADRFVPEGRHEDPDRPPRGAVELLLEADPHEDEVPAEGLTRTTPPSSRPDPALQMLMLAQRTADALVSAADRHADHLRADARVAADRLSSDVQLHAGRVRAEADGVLTEARVAAERTADMATVQAEAI